MKHPLPLALAAASLATLAACADPAAPPAADASDPSLARADAPGQSGEAGRPIPDEYIVVFRDDVDDAPGLARRLANENGADVRFTYEHAVRGFAGRMSAQAAAALARNPNVAYVEQDQEVTVAATQSNATWGIDRIDQRALPLSGTFTYTRTGSGVRAYIIDTGILRTHAQFGSRAVHGYSAIADGRGSTDCNGHGTHVAGTVGGSTYGVAKSVTLVAVRVLNCQGSGTNSGVIAGIDWVTANRVRPAVANLSLGGGASTAVDDAVKRMIAAGVAAAVAAGNSNANACNYSPARVPAAMTIGATDRTDTRASYSNYGSCVDFFAPGSSITSAWHTSTTATNTISGTSMATPHVAGVAALYLQGNTGASPQTVRDALYNATTKSVVKSASSTNAHLLYTSY